MKRVFAAILSLVLIISVSFMSACIQEANNYPLLVDDGNSGESIYHRNTAGKCFCLAILYISNIGKKPLTINNVALLDEENMTIIEISLMVVGKEHALVGFQSWPPASLEEFPNFNNRIAASGAILAPGEGYNLIVAVQLLAEKAGAAGLEIEYEVDGGKKYVERSYYAYGFDNNGLPK
jgi:hypothetical protein